jgi:hypothetical protein
MVRYLAIAVICILLAGCGGDQGEKRAAATATPTAQAASPAPGRLLALQRLGGVVATSETLYIGRDGAAALDRRHGGAGRRVEHFRITRERMAVIRRGLERLRAHPPREYADDPDRVAYTLWASGRSYRAQPGRMDRREQPLFRALEGVINGQARE